MQALRPIKRTETPIPIPISTRGIGIHWYNIAVKCIAHLGPKEDFITSVHVLAGTRVLYGLAAAKLRTAWYPSAHCDSIRMGATMLDRLARVSQVPTIHKHILQAMSVAHHNGVTYRPVLPNTVAETHQPRPDNLHLGNLRHVVVALSSQATPLHIRQYFCEHNPLPLAHFDANYLLTNADDIMPDNYDETKLNADIVHYQQVMHALGRRCPNFDNFVTTCCVAESRLSEAILATRYTEDDDIRVPTASAEGQELKQFLLSNPLRGDSLCFRSFADLEGDGLFVAAISLLGEYPSLPEHVSEVFQARAKYANPIMYLNTRFMYYELMYNSRRWFR